MMLHSATTAVLQPQRCAGISVSSQRKRTARSHVSIGRRIRLGESVHNSSSTLPYKAESSLWRDPRQALISGKVGFSTSLWTRNSRGLQRSWDLEGVGRLSRVHSLLGNLSLRLFMLCIHHKSTTGEARKELTLQKAATTFDRDVRSLLF